MIEEKTMKRLFGVLVLGVLASACTNVSPGYVGIRINKCSGGGVEDAPLSIGYHGVGPCTDVESYPVFQQTLILAKASNEGSQGDDSITVTSSEGLPINVDASVSFTIDPGKATGIYKKFREDIKTIEHTYIRQSVRLALQEVFARYTAQQLYSDKRETARAESQGVLVQKLGPDGFNVTQFTLNETRVPAAVTEAISAKVAMSQQAQQAEQAVRKTQAEAQQAIAKAEGESKAVRLRADAEAYANEVLAKSLSPALVEYKKAGKWDGHLPQVQGAGATMLNFGSK
jgi:regulator of protease activity HflC (stomatin/prohibitin superfamily)